MSQVINQDARRINPFAFPAETDALFRFLMVAALMIAVNVGFLLHKSYQLVNEPAAQSVGTDAAAQTIPAGNDSDEHFYMLLISIFFAAAVFALAFYLYKTHPRRLIENVGLETLTAEKDKNFLQEIENLSQSVGIESSAEVVIKKGLRFQDAQAFGTRGRFFLKFGEGWRLRRKKENSSFRAVALHELAHIFNRDVTLAYFAKSLWTAVFWLTLIPLILAMSAFLLESFYNRLTQPAAEDFSTWIAKKFFAVGTLCAQISAILLFFALVRTHLLRVREFYADYRAAIWGARPALVDILEREAAKEKSPPNRLAKFWRNHPTAFERLKILQEPHRLFRLTPDLPFTAGILLAFLMPGFTLIVVPMLLFVQKLMFVLSPDVEQARTSYAALGFLSLLLALTFFVSFFIVVAGGFFLSYLITRTLVLQILREAVQSLVHRRRKSLAAGRLLKTAFVVGIGYEVGFLIMPFAIFAPKNFAAAVWLLAWFPATVGLIWLVLIYARYFGVSLIKAHLGKAIPRWKLRLLLFATNALLVLPLLLQITVRLSMSRYDAATEQTVNKTLIYLSIGSVLVILAASAGSWLILQIWQSFRQPRCAACRAQADRRQFPGDFCGKCGSPLADWLFAKT